MTFLEMTSMPFLEVCQVPKICRLSVGSFYGRLFPKKSLHFVHSSSSLHWLSEVPQHAECNRKNISITRSSPQSAIDAYYKQFQGDFSVFLKSRAQELVPGGRMVLTMMGRRNEHPSSEERCCIWELLGMALDSMAMEGLIEDRKLVSFNVPIYMPSPTELKAQVLKEGSFLVNRLEVSEVDWSGKRAESSSSSNEEDGRIEGYDVAGCMRAVGESMLFNHFGQGIIKEVFRRYMLMFDDLMAKDMMGIINLTLSLTKLG
ncbi:hypothetical protein SAY87_017208 [Trapa incisa]|uniref:Uncharacterized protein n=1 Tax=Trapa incisa TaxID=236973 RepID=A0AAN7LJ98_9MYRT|nr:hypothetical protein SAY87_017208 [Trapa incisa]